MADEEVKTDIVSEENTNETSTESQANVVTDASPETTAEVSAPTEAEAAPAPEEKPAEPAPAETSTATSTPKPKGPQHSLVHMIIIAVLALLVVGLGLWAWTLHSDNQNLQKQVTELNNNPLLVAQKKEKEATQGLVDKVGALMSLPKTEVPQAVLVTDAAAARKGNPVFYANAENGDKILVYTQAGKAILYRPSTNKIILVAPLTTGSNTKQ